MTAVARNLLSTTSTATKHSLNQYCQRQPALSFNNSVVTRRELVNVLNACNLQQAVLESGYLSDGKSGVDAVAESNAFGWRPLHHAVGKSVLFSLYFFRSRFVE